MSVDPDVDHGDHDATTGRYVWIEFGDDQYRTYYEVAGDGDIPLLCLHTAGADSREYRHLLEDQDLQERFSMYAFDMPWHGRSYPPLEREWWTEEYRLTTEFYAGFIMRFVRTIGLDQPVVLGCSMGGEIVLQLAIECGDEVEAIIGLETTDHIPTEDRGYLDHLLEYLGHPEINQEVFRPEWIYGLQAPDSPTHNKYETWWIYSQAGHGAYAGDIHFYANEWDVRGRLDEIDTDECGVYFFTGEYDFSGRPQDTEHVADQIDGAQLEIMEDIGHFPPSENPAAFKQLLMPVVEEIVEERS